MREKKTGRKTAVTHGGRMEYRNGGSRREQLLSLNVALDRLEKSNARYARVVELRFFGGLSVEEAAEVMQVSSMTVKRDWTAARAWLKQQMQPGKSNPRDRG